MIETEQKGKMNVIGDWDMSEKIYEALTHFASELIPQSTSETIYHYTSIDGLLGIVQNKLWLSNSEFLNDSAELIYTSDLFSQLFRDTVLVPDKEQISIPPGSSMKDILWHQQLEIFALSLTENSDSITLWNNYANYEGYNLGFKRAELIECLRNYAIQNGFLLFYGKIIYDLEQQKKLLTRLIERYISNKTDIENISDFLAGVINHVDLSVQLNLYSLFFKHPSFSPEEEYRIVLIKSNHSFDVSFRHRLGIIIPYIEVGIDQIPITEINIGPKNNIDIAKLGVERFLSHSGHTNVKIHKSAVPLRY
ncbi:DUF2971 domain-containing protein [Brevibacillus dissolubilis]|uniref:DUF2971 domain-containing protein n=1 Tax=Brevibacillus dissolubilis TaxID=1844116 RepID=UPI00159B8B45|nr:DUF2971 domain-containing protein [Brevibacillus dissolubilis]